MKHTILGRAIGTLAATAALSLGLATAASAHHCYKVDWNEAAYANQASNGSPWMPLSAVGAMVISEEIGLPQCAGYASVAVDYWMQQTGTATEPLIHTRATVGGGALANNPQGKTSPAIAYLGESDFAILETGLGMAIDQCMAAQPS